MISQVTPKFNKVLEIVSQDLASIRTGKASPKLIENIPVEAYGTKMKLVELGTISAVDTSTLIVTPFDVLNTAGTATAIQAANLGLTAIVEDTRVRVVVPPLSEERREEYIKLAKTKVEGGKIMARQIRHDAMEEISRSSTDEDSKDRLEKEIQKLTDDTVEKLDSVFLEKEKELLTI